MCKACGRSVGAEVDEKILDTFCSVSAVQQELTSSFPAFRAFALGSLRDSRDADDVVQTFSLKALERASQLRQPRAARGWLWRMLKTTLIDYCRRRSRQRAHEVRFELDRHDLLVEEAPVSIEEPRRLVCATLGRLRKEYARVIIEVDLRERPAADVAEELGITSNNLAVRLHRARHAARREIRSLITALDG